VEVTTTTTTNNYNTVVVVAGAFGVDQHLDVIGQVADDANPFLLSLEVIDTISAKFTATSHTATQRSGDQTVTLGGTTARFGEKQPVFNRGMCDTF